ncbi:2-oxo acid dehydrogenase subunit E2 [Buchnera aphidicola (Pemphigus obesinymphae)]|uniref:2-oxo acid dehydrogenase subunit E2 n=1 Tax=Buchnera aphidicola TaxID=9 RepID=UPI002237E65E|nr:2-oxo acid dehydrogenase subunit E2 [Buchnera aphidicola]MCW5196654.1 2-oxo acid dehydrogenase subunit E2 [Buchnera aphidicola (Pemphigus obesinymphae)]
MVIEIKVPDIGLEKVEVTEILVNVGDLVTLEEGLITVEGQKASMEIPAPVNGVVKEIKVNVGNIINTGDVMMVFEVQDNINLKNSTLEEEKKLYNIGNDENKKKIDEIHATPLIRRLARKLDISLQNVKGTGPKNRILKEDLKKYNKNSCKKDDIDYINNYLNLNNKNEILEPIDQSFKNLKLNHVQIISGQNLSQSWRQIPHVTHFYESDITELDEFRKKCNMKYQDDTLNIKLTILVFVIKIVSKALQEFPRFNSSISNDQKTLIIKKHINIGIAVNTSKGLLVPVLKFIENKNLLEISKELISISKKAREGNLALSDMQDGCFTISNLGGLGGIGFTPIINMPEVGILGISKSSIKPIWNGKKFVPKLILPFSLSYDHRVIDGVYAAHFMDFINTLLLDIRFIMM